MTKIALLTPTRGRPEQFKRMVESVGKTTSGTWSCWAAIDEDGSEKYHQHWSRIVTVDGMPTVYKWNLLAKYALQDDDNKLFMLAADDMVFDTPGWDRALIKHYEALENKIHVYSLRDSRDPDGTPHPVVTREYMEAMGYFVSPIFLHWFVDTWTVAIANGNNAFTHLKDYLLIHDKPSDKGQPDETHSRIRRQGWHERDKYVNETCGHFLKTEINRLAEFMLRDPIYFRKQMAAGNIIIE